MSRPPADPETIARYRNLPPEPRYRVGQKVRVAYIPEMADDFKATCGDERPTGEVQDAIVLRKDGAYETHYRVDFGGIWIDLDGWMLDPA